MKNRKRTQLLCALTLTASVALYGNGIEGRAQDAEDVAAESFSDAEKKEKTVESEEETSTRAYQETEIADTDPETDVEEVISTEEVTEAEEEVILEPDYHSEQDPNPTVNQIQQSLGKREREQIHPVTLPDPEWIAINGEKATCTSYAKLQYGYTPEVQVGTIRYISQISGSGLFDWSYWGGWGNQAGIECGTASISMALSYVGVNLTPQEILDAHGGLTSFTGWGVTDLSPDVGSAVEQYVHGRGQYSPVIVHLPTYSQLGHYVVLIGKISDTEYLVLDCAQDSTWVMSIYSDFYNSIDQVYQYYNPNAPVLDHELVVDQPVMATCTSMGLTAGKHCQVCGEVVKEQQVVPCNGHAWSEWVTSIQPEIGKTGEKIRVCQVCGQTDSRVVEALPEEFKLQIPEVYRLGDIH